MATCSSTCGYKGVSNSSQVCFKIQYSSPPIRTHTVVCSIAALLTTTLSKQQSQSVGSSLSHQPKTAVVCNRNVSPLTWPHKATDIQGAVQYMAHSDFSHKMPANPGRQLCSAPVTLSSHQSSFF